MTNGSADTMQFVVFAFVIAPQRMRRHDIPISLDFGWQMEYHPGHFERLHHLRKKYAFPACEKAGDSAQAETAAKPEAAIDKGMAGAGVAGLYRYQQIR